MPPVAVHDERPRLGWQLPAGHLLAHAVVRVVAFVDLLLDEGDVLRGAGADLLDDVDDRAADAALAQLRRGEGDDRRTLAERVGEVDLMQVKAEILSEQSTSKASPDVRKQLETEFNEIVTENAYDNIATQPQPGEYLLLKDRGKPAAEVMDQLSAAAQRMSIAPAELGLAAKTVAMESLNGDFSQANINGVVYDLRHDPTRPVKQWELEPESESWIKPVIRGAAAALGLKPPRTDR